MEMIILDENQKVLAKFRLKEGNSNNPLRKVDEIRDIDEKTKKLLDALDYYTVGVYSPTKDNNDFYVSFMNNSILYSFYYNLEDIKGVCVSDVFFSYDEHGLILSKMKEAFYKNKPQKLYFEYYNKKILHRRLNATFKRIDDFLYILGRDETDYMTLYKEQDNLFENDSNAMSVIQENYFVKVNKKYLEVFNLNSYDNVIGQKLNYNGVNDDNINEITENFNKILDGKMFSYSMPPIEIENNGKLTHYFNLKGYYVLHNSKPAVRVVYYDILEEELRKRKLEKKTKESLLLQKYMDTIQSISNTCSAYVINGKFIRSKQLYKILERDPFKEDEKKDILWDIVLDEDKHILEENYKKLTPENNNIQFIIRIRTGKGNIKYIQCYITLYYLKNNRHDVVSFYQDVTNGIKHQQQIEVALKDKKMLLTEVHHRVKNNLQIILSLINLNKNYGNDNKKILDDTEHRIYAMALLHEKIYSSTSLSEVNIKDYVETLVNSLFDTYLSEINFVSDLDPINIDMDISIPLGLIINELVTNTIKYAFPDSNQGNLFITFKKIGSKYILTVEDDGIGLPLDFDLDSLSSLGLIVVQNLVVQIDGTISIIDCKGTGYKIEFEEE